MLKEYCLAREDLIIENDEFVGVRFVKGESTNDFTPQVIFPLGYNLPDDDKELRKEVIRLLSVIKTFAKEEQGDGTNGAKETISSFPLYSYLYIIQDFFAHGYYTEKEVRYFESPRGKISWKRTIQKERPIYDGQNAVYLKFQVRTNKVNSDNIISKIHRFCVYQSFSRFGWLFLTNDYMPQKPTFTPNNKFAIAVLRKELAQTFNDSKKRLLQSMIDIIEDNESTINLDNISIGVKKFAPVWEGLVDFTFGDNDKDDYYPRAHWYTNNRNPVCELNPLRVDSIMRCKDKPKALYILDAKYYKYGVNKSGIPGASDIQKQITYGRNAAKVELKAGRMDTNIYNAFIMPFKADDPINNPIIQDLVATVDWEDYDKNTENYKFVLGIFADTKTLISNYIKHNDAMIEELADLIEESLKKYRSNNNM